MNGSKTTFIKVLAADGVSKKQEQKGRIMSSHYEEHLQQAIDQIGGQISEMTRLATEALRQCLRALQTRDRKLAYTVILRDQRIDELEKKVDRLCLEFLIRQQPAGSHLRFAYGAIKLNAELERIGDYAESIAQQILKTSKLDPYPPLDLYEQLAHLAIPMLQDAVKAFLNHDEALARKTMLIENEADTVRYAITDQVVQLQQEKKIPLEAFTPLLTIARRFERVTDQAKNICEEALYVATGVYAKHRSAGLWNILFVDQENGCLSQMAEAIGHSLNEKSFQFKSAGVSPQTLNPFTLSFLAGKGISTDGLEAKSIDQVSGAGKFQVAVAFGKSPKTLLSAVPEKSTAFEWTVEDPSTTQGSAEEVHQAYQAAYEFLLGNITDLVQAIIGDQAADAVDDRHD